MKIELALRRIDQVELDNAVRTLLTYLEGDSVSNSDLATLVHMATALFGNQNNASTTLFRWVPVGAPIADGIEFSLSSRMQICSASDTEAAAIHAGQSHHHDMHRPATDFAVVQFDTHPLLTTKQLLRLVRTVEGRDLDTFLTHPVKLNRAQIRLKVEREFLFTPHQNMVGRVIRTGYYQP